MCSADRAYGRVVTGGEVGLFVNDGCPGVLALGDRGYRYDASDVFNSNAGYIYDASPRLSSQRSVRPGDGLG
jgi:hypothetical protein